MTGKNKDKAKLKKQATIIFEQRKLDENLIS